MRADDSKQVVLSSDFVTELHAHWIPKRGGIPMAVSINRTYPQMDGLKNDDAMEHAIEMDDELGVARHDETETSMTRCSCQVRPTQGAFK